MTTEIYRNSLFEKKSRFACCRWVIFDEVHYLDDPERGTVWEEALLLTPRETEILALRATIPNAKELAAWIEQIHGRPVKVIEETHRPVPLKFGFQCQDQLYWDLGSVKAKGYQNQEEWRVKSPGRRPSFKGRRHSFRWIPQHPQRPLGRANQADQLVKLIRSAGHLPCLYFTFSRRRVEELAWEFAALGLLPPEKKAPLMERFEELCKRYQISHEPSAATMRELVAQGVAFHHAGLLPTLKEVVEILFASRLIQTIVTTETFALGVNMPARSVVLDTLVKRSNGPKTVLRVRELSQMAGRAGRRGMDEVGFVYLRVNPWEVPFPELTHLIQGKPERVVSHFSSTYATLLNLYQSYGQDLTPFYRQTFHAFQTSLVDQRQTFGLVERKLKLLQQLGYMKPKGLTPKGIFAANLYGYELILSELFEKGFLETLDLTDLGIFLLGMVYEPRRGGPPVKLPRRIGGMAHQVQEVLNAIHRQERELRIGPLTKGPAFHLSMAMERWIGGAAFEKVVQQAQVDEGELIRYFRMTVQLARGLFTSPTASQALKHRARELFSKINRDPVDAEAELRRSL